MSIVNKHKSAENITTPAANYTTLFFDENGELASKDSDGNITQYSPAGDAAGITYTPDNSLIWTDSTDPGNVAEALDDLAVRLNVVENDTATPPDASEVTYTPQTSLHWTDSEDPVNVDDALDDLAARVQALEENPAGASNLDDLGDVNAPAPNDGDVLTYDTGTGEWIASAPAGASAFDYTYVPAGAITPSVTGGCQSLTTIASAANQPDIQTLNFDATTQEYAQFSVVPPDNWSAGTVTFEPVWSHPSTTTNFGVVWDLQAVAVSNDDAIAVAYGTAQTSTDTGGTTNDLYTGPVSSAITIAGTPAVGDMVFFRISRVTGNGSDTLAVDARLHGVRVHWA